MDNTIEKLTDVIDNLIELNEENYSEGNGVYQRGYLNGYHDALVDVLSQMRVKTSTRTTIRLRACIMEDIDADKIFDVITFLQYNEQYGGDWSDEIAELYKVLNAIDGAVK